MSLLFFITSLVIAGVNLYCWIHRNKSINDVSKFWSSAVVVMLGLSAAFIMDFLKAPVFAYIIAYIPTAIAGYILCRISIYNVRGDWQEMKNEKEVAAEIKETKKASIDYVKQAISELPQKGFSSEFNELLIEKLHQKNEA
jgi:hypothetical protein